MKRMQEDKKAATRDTRQEWESLTANAFDFDVLPPRRRPHAARDRQARREAGDHADRQRAAGDDPQG